MKNIKVSIITPCLNSAVTIRQTIESVLKQTYTNIEYIIVDGESKDGTLDIIREYIPLFGGRLRYISEKDNGIYSAMNKGIRLSKGLLIGIINSDDYYENDAVEKIVQHMTNDKYQVLYGYCRLIKNNRITGMLKNRHEILEQRMIPHPTCFITRWIYRDFGLFLTVFKIAGDYDLMLRLYYSGKVTFIQVKKIIANFRIGGACSDLERVKREDAMIRYHYKAISFTDMIINILGLDVD